VFACERGLGIGVTCGRGCVDGARIFDANPEPAEPEAELEPERMGGLELAGIPGVVVSFIPLVLLVPMLAPAEGAARTRGARDVDADGSERDFASIRL
jgi:hypothetical protein